MVVSKMMLTSRQILLYLLDGLVTAASPFDRHGLYRKYIADYYDWRDFDKKRFHSYLKRMADEGLIKLYKSQKKDCIALTKKGKERVRNLLIQEFPIKYPQKWDFKWRLVIFDIPDTKKQTREAFREKLKSIGFHKLQESVFVFPFDCQELIEYCKNLYAIRPCVQYIVADSIETELDLLRIFSEEGILNKSMLKS